MTEVYVAVVNYSQFGFDGSWRLIVKRVFRRAEDSVAWLNKNKDDSHHEHRIIPMELEERYFE